MLLAEGKHPRNCKRKTIEDSPTPSIEDPAPSPIPDRPSKRTKNLHGKAAKPKANAPEIDEDEDEEDYDWSSQSITVYPFVRIKLTVPGGTKKNPVPKEKIVDEPSEPFQFTLDNGWLNFESELSVVLGMKRTYLNNIRTVIFWKLSKPASDPLKVLSKGDSFTKLPLAAWRNFGKSVDIQVFVPKDPDRLTDVSPI